MNQKAQRIISKIDLQVKEISVQFELVLAIFGTEENLRIINATAPNVFTQFHKSLIEAVVIGLNRLCDPAEDSRKNKNLSIKRLRMSLPKGLLQNKNLHDNLAELESAIEKEIGKLNKYRSKRIAHNDYLTHARNWHRTIPNSAIDKSLEFLEQYLNHIRLHFDDPTVQLLKPQYPPKDGPKRLMAMLRRSMNCKPAHGRKHD